MTRRHDRVALHLGGGGLALAAYLSGGTSNAAGDWPAGTVTSAGATSPTGTIAANGTGNYPLTAKWRPTPTTRARAGRS